MPQEILLALFQKELYVTNIGYELRSVHDSAVMMYLQSTLIMACFVQA